MDSKIRYHTTARKKTSEHQKETGQWEGIVLTLPDTNEPIVCGILTRSQIASIPRDQFEVTVLGVVERDQEKTIKPKELEELLYVAIRRIGQSEKDFQTVLKGLRILMRNGGGGEPPTDSLFLAPIDEGKMSDCIVGIINKYFHNGNKCTIYDKNYSLTEFCVLIHIFFDYIKVLKNKSCLSFSSFLQDKVFAGKSEFSVRTYNTYANKSVFSKLEKKLQELENKKIKISFKNHPTPPDIKDPDYLMKAFQEVGWAFQHSDYFKELIKLRNTMQLFYLE